MNKYTSIKMNENLDAVMHRVGLKKIKALEFYQRQRSRNTTRFNAISIFIMIIITSTILITKIIKK